MSGYFRQAITGIVSREPVFFMNSDETQGIIFPLDVKQQSPDQNNHQNEATWCYTCRASSDTAQRIHQNVHKGMHVMAVGLTVYEAYDVRENQPHLHPSMIGLAGQPKAYLNLLIQTFKVLNVDGTPLESSQIAPTRIPQKPSKPAPIPKKPTFYIEEDGEYEEEAEQEKRQKYEELRDGQYEEYGGYDNYMKHSSDASDLGFTDVDFYLNWLND